MVCKLNNIYFVAYKNCHTERMIHMTTITIKLSTINDVRNFVNAVTAFDCEADLKSGRYVVDAKSIMGIFSLDLVSPIEMTIHSDDCDELVKKLDAFIVR